MTWEIATVVGTLGLGFGSLYMANNLQTNPLGLALCRLFSVIFMLVNSWLVWQISIINTNSNIQLVLMTSSIIFLVLSLIIVFFVLIDLAVFMIDKMNQLKTMKNKRL